MKTRNLFFLILVGYINATRYQFNIDGMVRTIEFMNAQAEMTTPRSHNKTMQGFYIPELQGFFTTDNKIISIGHLINIVEDRLTSIFRDSNDLQRPDIQKIIQDYKDQNPNVDWLDNANLQMLDGNMMLYALLNERAMILFSDKGFNNAVAVLKPKGSGFFQLLNKIDNVNTRIVDENLYEISKIVDVQEQPKELEELFKFNMLYVQLQKSYPIALKLKRLFSINKDALEEFNSAKEFSEARFDEKNCIDYIIDLYTIFSNSVSVAHELQIALTKIHILNNPAQQTDYLLHNKEEVIKIAQDKAHELANLISSSKIDAEKTMLLITQAQYLCEHIERHFERKDTQGLNNHFISDSLDELEKRAHNAAFDLSHSLAQVSACLDVIVNDANVSMQLSHPMLVSMLQQLDNKLNEACKYLRSSGHESHSNQAKHAQELLNNIKGFLNKHVKSPLATFKLDAKELLSKVQEHQEKDAASHIDACGVNATQEKHNAFSDFLKRFQTQN